VSVEFFFKRLTFLRPRESKEVLMVKRLQDYLDITTEMSVALKVSVEFFFKRFAPMGI